MKTYKPGDPFKYAHVKLDGHRVRLVGQQVYCNARPIGMTVDVPKDTIAEGELYVPGYPASEVSRALVTARSVLKLELFSIERLNGKRVPLIAPLEEVAALSPLPFAQFFTAQQFDLKAMQPHDQVIKCEGWVLKDGNLLNWRKFKFEKTIDAVITSYKPGNGKFAGLVGSLVVAVYDLKGNLIEVASVGGMDDETRQLITDYQDKLLGTVVEVKYQYVGAGNRLRHPRFVRLRDDKAPLACTIEQDENLC